MDVKPFAPLSKMDKVLWPIQGVKDHYGQEYFFKTGIERHDFPSL
ncbi:MAG: hypothetical protein FD159_885 [Syntrophaceae bacterium]|nr:MAG: hypothetical protein FD159_885 [Syntrophaceae bacterium]